MPSAPTTIVADAAYLPLTSWGGRTVDFMQNGYLWVVMKENTGGGGAKSVRFYRSTDNGATWTESTSSRLTDGHASFTPAMFIDKDDYAHLLYHQDSGSYFVYRRGTPAGDRLSYTWSSPVSLSAYGFGQGTIGNDIVAHREGSGWKVHATTNQVNGSAQTVVVYHRINITSGGTISVDTNSDLHVFGGTTNTAAAMDFRHDAADPKVVQSSTPSVYVAYYASGGTLLYKKITYSAGVWTIGSLRTIDASAQGTNRTLGCVYDGTRVMVCSTQDGTPTVARVFERDEADTTTTTRTPTALADGNINSQTIGVGRSSDVWLLAQGVTSFDWKVIRFNRGSTTWDGTWTVLEADSAVVSGSGDMLRGPAPSGLAAVYGLASATPDTARFAHLVESMTIEANMQGVATITTADVNLRVGVEAALQGVATVSPILQLRAAAEVLMQGVARISTAEIEGVPFHDFTVYDAYLESSIRSEGLLFFDEQKPETVSRKLTPTRQDVGNNPFEIRPEFGDMFAQGDFSHGGGQRYFHQEGNDSKKYWYSEGFDISEPGKLTHLRAIAEARDSSSIGRIEQVGDLPFVVNAQRVDRGDGNWPGTWTAEDPSAADADQTVNDICAEGARLYAALNVSPASVRIRDSGGTWTHFQVGGVDLVVGTATRLAWLMSRLMVVGGTNARSIYEVAASATPTAIETLPEGWIFSDLFEAEGFIHATAVNASAGLSRVHHYGLNSTFSALEKKSSTPFPQGQLIYAGCGFPGLAFIGGGVRNSSGGYDPILYRAAVGQERGELQYEEIRQETGAGAADLSVRAMIPMGETILAGWSLGAAAYGGARDGIAIYHIARNAFAHHLRKTAAGGALRVGGIMPFKGRVLISITGDGLYYEDLATYMTTASLHTSAADWNNAGLKVWDQIEISHDPLAASHSFAVAYTTETFETATWNPVFTSDLDGATREDGRLSNVKARQFALRITSTATASASPVFLAYNVRSLPSPVSPEFQLTRFIRLLGKDRKDEDAPFVFNDPTDLLAFLQDSIYQFVNFYESNASWIAWLEDVSTVEPEQPFYDLTQGEALKDAFVVRLQMTGTR